MIRALLALLMLAGPAAALDLKMPATARLTVERDTTADVYAAPVGVFDEGEVARITIEGEIRRAAWRLESPGLTPLQVMRPLREQVSAAGYEIVLDCAAAACGGFDFRFATEVLPGPNMYVNIRAYHFVTAIRREDNVPREVITVLASTSATAAHVQIIQARAQTDGAASQPAEGPGAPASEMPSGALADQLLSQGHAVLGGLDFGTGSAELTEGRYASLAALADFLNAQPGMRVALVGHTDSVGGLAGNVALSKRRAQSVRQRLIDLHNVNAAQMEAEGMGYLSPVASNLKESGREANRRVEVVLLRLE